MYKKIVFHNSWGKGEGHNFFVLVDWWIFIDTSTVSQRKHLTSAGLLHNAKDFAVTEQNSSTVN